MIKKANIELHETQDVAIKNNLEPVKLEIVQKRERNIDPLLWYDVQKNVDFQNQTSVFHRLNNLKYSGIIVYLSNIDILLPLIPARFQKIVHINDEKEFNLFIDNYYSKEKLDKQKWIVSSTDIKILNLAKQKQILTCYRINVVDNSTLHQAINFGLDHAYLMINFQDPTNIPLELVIASLQFSNTILIKEISSNKNVEDAIVSLGVMEVGADGIAFSPIEHAVLDEFNAKLNKTLNENLPLQVGTITRSEPIGMGYRGCVDIVTLFTPTEGILVGSTSQGGILCCSEVFHLPYMELRPFRVNAGGIHSYIYNFNDSTNYMSELRAGSQIMIVDVNGKSRRAVVGRVKIEIRPLRLIEVEFSNNKKVNVIMQDDWHVRIFSADGLPLNITELQIGDKVLGYEAKIGRHVGIKVEENIIEN